MPNLSGKWTQTQVLFNDLGWYKIPGAPTSVSATNGNFESVVSFTAPADTGQPAITGYKVTASTGGSIVATVTGSASPLTVSGLTATTYDITVVAQNAAGDGPAGTTTATPLAPSQLAYTTAGIYTFVVPPGLNPATVSVITVGSGGAEGGGDNRNGGGGGALVYGNNLSVTSGEALTVRVGIPGYNSVVAESSYIKRSGTSLVEAGGGTNGLSGGSGGNVIVPISAGVGGNGGNGGSTNGSGYGGGGGAGGYGGNGGTGGNASSGNGSAGSGGGGGGGGGGTFSTGRNGGGGVGILGLGANGPGGTVGVGGIGGSGGAQGSSSGQGGTYGGGGAASSQYGGVGAVRIIYSFNGTARSFPSINTGDL